MSDVGLLLPTLEADAASLAVRAESLGYESVWLGELWGTAAPVRLTEIAVKTDEIRLGSAILNVFSRTPATLAMTAATLYDVSDGRFALGVGTSTAKAIEDLHSMSFDRPVRRAHETIELTKAFLRDDGAVEYEGELFEVADFPALGRDVPVYHAALGQANRRVVARLCDGWIPHNIPFPDLPEAFSYIESHTPDGRSGDDIAVAPYVPSAVADNPDEARDVIRGHVAYYVGSGEGYKRAVGSRFPDAAERVQTAWRAGDRADATAAVTDEMVSALGVAGTPASARDQLREIAAMDVVDEPLVTIPANADADVVERTMTELAPNEW